MLENWVHLLIQQLYNSLKGKGPLFIFAINSIREKELQSGGVSEKREKHYFQNA